MVTGFLGAGKTTLINQLLSTKPAGARWALLINEFGRIGIDSALLDTNNHSDKQGIAIREVSGGCICCTSQLPLQIAISRLLGGQRPQRLLIEPTGLAHPHELVSQLSEPHWQTSLSMKAVITVLNARQWQQEKYRNHDGFQAHVRAADVLVINRYAEMDKDSQQALATWVTSLNNDAHLIWDDSERENGNAIETSSASIDHAATAALVTQLSAVLDQPSTTIKRQRANTPQQTRISLSPPRHLQMSASTDNEATHVNATLPYRYHDAQQGMVLGGWRLPADWIFAADTLQQWLLGLPEWQRIKGVVNTSEGWLKLNFTPDSITVSNTEAQIDSRLEMILSSHQSPDTIHGNAPQSDTIDWDEWDHELMALLVAG